MNGQMCDRILSEHDYARLEALSARHPRTAGAGLHTSIEEVLDEALVVPVEDVPAQIATVHSEVVLRDVATGKTQRITLCLPTDSAPAAGCVSVLSPVGMSLIGRPAGFVARWRCPDGEERMAELTAVLGKPETVREKAAA